MLKIYLYTQRIQKTITISSFILEHFTISINFYVLFHNNDSKLFKFKVIFYIIILNSGNISELGGVILNSSCVPSIYEVHLEAI